jgi:hypothetical protein
VILIVKYISEIKGAFVGLKYILCVITFLSAKLIDCISAENGGDTRVIGSIMMANGGDKSSAQILSADCPDS